MCVGEGIGVLVDVGESLIVGVGGSITPVVGVAVRREADSPTNELLVHAATTTMMQNSNIISLNGVIATSFSYPVAKRPNDERQRRGGFHPKHPLQDTIIETIAPIPPGQSPIRCMLGWAAFLWELMFWIRCCFDFV